jgi:hypothetical protein
MLYVLVTQALFAGFAVLGVLAYQGKRWAFGAFFVLAIVYFPIRSDFHFLYRPCEVAFDWSLAVYSLQNFNHIILFFAFFLMAAAQLPMARPRHFVVAIAMTLAMGLIVEASEAMWSRGNCRVRDLIPDGVGALIGTVTVMVRQRLLSPGSPGR